MRHDNPNKRSTSSNWIQAALGCVVVLWGVGYVRCSPQPPSTAGERLRARFPQLASRALGASSPDQVATFATQADEFISAQTTGTLTLPRFATEAVRWTIPGVAEIQIAEQELSGPGGKVEGALAYPRINGHSFWTPAVPGFEEWLHVWNLEGTSVARWRVTGVTMRSRGSAVELLDDSGAVRGTVTVPEAYALGGRAVPARLLVEGTTLSLVVDSPAGWVLVDPLWTPTTGPLGASRDFHTSTPVLGGTEVLTVAGEQVGTGLLATAELYSAGTWSAAGSLPTARKWHTATLLRDGRVLVAGGFFDGGSLADSQVYDPNTNSWTPAGTMNVARWFHTATLLGDGTVLVAGGLDGGSALDVAEIWDAGTWTKVATAMTGARYRHTATLLQDGGVLLAGGAGTGGASLKSAEVYSGTFGATQVMGTAHAAHTATLLKDGRVLIAGDQVATSAAEVFTPAGTWMAVSGMADPRGEHAAASLANGAVVVSGGNAVPGIAKSELFDPSSNAWRSAGCLVVPRYRHTATALANGTLLIAGGFDGGVSLSASEIYDPDGGALGSSCTVGCQCQSGFCANGVCCNTSCDGGTCMACSAAAGGTAADGTCSNLSAGTVCRLSAGVCDVAETCTGSSGVCPPDGFQSNSTVCRSDAGTCDFAALCPGNAATCPANAMVLANTPCRPDAGACDITEVCNGTTAQCPADMFLPKDAPGVPACPSSFLCPGGSAICPSPCQNDAQCPQPNAYCNAGLCESKRGNGASCSGNNVCQFGHCVSGVCCSSACTGACQACLVSAGAAVDGTCGSVRAGTAGSPSCGAYVCDGQSASCPTSCSNDAQCAASDTCVNKQCASKSDGGVLLGYSGWHCGCTGGSGDTAIGGLLLATYALTFRRRRLRRTSVSVVLGCLAAVGSLSARASPRLLEDTPVRTVIGLDDITGSHYRDADELAWLHLYAAGFYEFNAHNAGAEVGVTLSPAQYVDFGLGAVLGQYIGGRVTAAVHPGSGWVLRPFLQLRGLVHPVPGTVALGGGAQVGLSLALGPGHLSAGAAGELYKGSPQFESQALFAMLGYEVDLLHSSSRDSTPEPTPFVTDTAPVPEEKPLTAPKPPPAAAARVTAQPELPMPPPPNRAGPAAPAQPPPPVAADVPQEGAARVSVRIVIRDRIEFEVNKVRLRPKYLPVIKKVAGILKRFPQIKKLALDGHADDPGSDAVNQKLSSRRAVAVMEALTKEGVDVGRLDPRGNGRAQPLVQHGSKKAREANRRVEFNIVDPADQAP